MTKMMQAASIPVPTRAVPGWLVRAVAYAGETTFRGLGLTAKPPLTRFTANIMSRDCILNDKKAHVELGYAPTVTMDQGLETLRRSFA
jgi:nucleoside-diphosphate-sugar epimerase